MGFAQEDRLRDAAEKRDQVFVDREAGGGVEHLIARLEQRQQPVPEQRLGAGTDHGVLGGIRHAAELAADLGAGGPQGGIAGRRGVPRPIGMQRVDRGLLDDLGRRETRLADREAYYVVARPLQRLDLGQHVERPLRLNARTRRASGGT